MQKIKKHLKYYFIAMLVLVCIFVWSAVFAESRDGLKVVFLDVGQGDAIFIEAQNGNQILLDGGVNKKVLRELGKIMPFYDRSIDLIIESHPDADHIAGLIDVLSRYNVDAVMESGVDTNSPVYYELEKTRKEKNVQKILARRGVRINLDEEIYMDILFPDRDVAGLDPNDASIIAKLVYGNTSFLFTGDSPQKMENYLVSMYREIPDGLDKLNVDVLKIGHHGSRTSTSQNLIGYSSPKYAVISVGADNTYGHPHDEVLNILEQFDIKILRTDELGTITIKSDGESIVIR